METQKTAPVLPGTKAEAGVQLEMIQTTGGDFRVDAGLNIYQLMAQLQAAGVALVLGREEG